MSDDSGYGGYRNPPSGYGGSAGTDYLASMPSAAPYGASGQDYAPYSSPQPDASPAPAPISRQPLIGNGVNLQPSYSNKGDVDLGWDYLKSLPAVKLVRLEIEDFAVASAVRWIKEAVGYGYSVIATYHNFEAINNKPRSDDPKHMNAAITFWNENYQTLAAAGPFFINLMNEWGNAQIKPKDYADQHNIAMRAIRALGYNLPIIIDLPGSGQRADIAVAAVTGAGGISPISDRNIILSMHVYPEAWNGKDGITLADLDAMVATGLPCMIGEFGESNKEPRTDWRSIVTYARSLGWPVLAWAWDGDGNVMNMLQPEFQTFVPGKPSTVYRLNQPYLNIVLPYLS